MQLAGEEVADQHLPSGHPVACGDDKLVRREAMALEPEDDR